MENKLSIRLEFTDKQKRALKTIAKKQNIPLKNYLENHIVDTVIKHRTPKDNKTDKG